MFIWFFPSKKRRYEVAKLVFNQVYCSPKNSDLENSMPLQTPGKAPLPINIKDKGFYMRCLSPFGLCWEKKTGIFILSTLTIMTVDKYGLITNIFFLFHLPSKKKYGEKQKKG